MGVKRRTESGVITRSRGNDRRLFADVFNWYTLTIICIVSGLLAAGAARANDSYYDGGVKSSVFEFQYSPGLTCGTAGCHDSSLGTCNSLDDTNWSDYNCAYDFRVTTKSYIDIDYMPLGGPYTSNAAFSASLTTWANAGYPKSAATVGSLTKVESKNSAELGATFDTNTLEGGIYFLEYGTTLGYGTPVFNNVARNSIDPLTISASTATDLACNTTHFYRASATNGAASSAFATGTFTTTACDPPEISGGTTALMSEDGAPTPFTAPNLSVVVNVDNDPGDLSWSVSSQPVISGTSTPAGSATATGSGDGESIGYTPPLNFVGDAEFTVRVTNATTTLFDEHTITVTVTEVNDPPEISEGDGPLILAATDEDTPAMHTLNATDPESDPVTWTVESGPNHGTVDFPTGTGDAKTFTFTPGADATATGIYTVRATTLSQFDEIVVNVPITAVNDSPLIDPIDAQAATEGVALMVTPTVDDPDDPNDGSGALTWSITGPADFLALGMSIDNSGIFAWTPPLGTAPTPAVFDDIYSVTIHVQDDTGGSTPDTETFTVTVNPPDTDTDMVADYNDFCPGAAPSPTSTDSSNADFDGDGTRGSDADPTDNVGGDVCDADDDNDGMPDSFEIANSFDPFDAADASEDADGDGISNLDEYNNGTSPNLENLAIDATGYLTPYELVPPEPTSIHSLATALTPELATPAVSSSASGPYRPGNNTIVWVPSNNDDVDLRDDPGLVTDPPEMPFFVRPLASFEVDQQVEENSASIVTVTVRLNGDSPSWVPLAIPATVNYTVSGTANNPADHNAVAGVLNFAVGEYAQDISFNVLTDGVADPDETIVFTLTGVGSAAIGSNNTHTVTILENNIAPRARLQFSQGGFAVGSAYEGSAITVDATPSDANGAQVLSCDWSGTDNALLPPGAVADCVTTPSWMIAVPVAGNYLLDVVVSDNGSPAMSTSVSRILHVSAGATLILDAADDSDLDGMDDLSEGFADADADGIPAYLDAIDGTVAGGNLMPDQTADPGDSLLLETEPGLTMRRGSTTQAANVFGALVTDSDIAGFGSVRGDPPVNGADSFEHVGGIYDFEIDGVIPGSSARIVIPLQSAIPQDAHYRKFNPVTGWSDFVVDDNNLIASASGELGACPEPGSSAYLDGLNYLDNCVQLTIQDGGPNDTGNRVNGIINDPATVGLEIAEPEGFEEVEEGSGGRVSPLLLAVLLMLGGLAYWRRQKSVRING